MGWNQRNARFYCKVESARSQPEVILSDASNGIDIVVAGEYGSLRIRVWARDDDQYKGRKLVEKRVDKFSIDFEPWRKSEKKGSLTIAEGVLDFDDHTYDNVMVRLGEEVLEAFNFCRAKEVMLSKKD